MNAVYIQQTLWRVTVTRDVWHVTSTLKRTITKSTLKRTITKSTLIWVAVLCALRRRFTPGARATSTKGTSRRALPHCHCRTPCDAACPQLSKSWRMCRGLVGGMVEWNGATSSWCKEPTAVWWRVQTLQELRVWSGCWWLQECDVYVSDGHKHTSSPCAEFCWQCSRSSC